MLRTTLLLVFAALVGIIAGESVHWQWREVSCAPQKDGGKNDEQKDAAPCSLVLRETEFDTNGRNAPSVNGNGCFDEIVNGTTKTYCNIGCPKADTAYMIKRTPQIHRSCFGHLTYRVVRRGTEWFVWRDGKCRSSQVEFTIRCEFLFPRAEFPDDEAIFARLSKPAILPAKFH